MRFGFAVTSNVMNYGLIVSHTYLIRVPILVGLLTQSGKSEM